MPALGFHFKAYHRIKPSRMVVIVLHERHLLCFKETNELSLTFFVLLLRKNIRVGKKKRGVHVVL